MNQSYIIHIQDENDEKNFLQLSLLQMYTMFFFKFTIFYLPGT